MGLKLLREELSTLFNDIAGSAHDAILPPCLSEETIDIMIGEEVEGSRRMEDAIIHTSSDQAHDILSLTKQILGSAFNAIEVLNDILNYDKIETGKLQLEKTVLDIWELMDHVVCEFQLPYKASEITLAMDWSEIPCDEETGRPKEATIRNFCVVGDAMKITLVFRNILSNALKFTPRGGMFHHVQ